MKVAGQLLKMTHEAARPIRYFLSLGGEPVAVSPRLGQKIGVRFLGKITCVECGRAIKKTYSEGYCFPCARGLPENAMCSVRPELCEHDRGNERDREFYRTHCNVDHFIYLSLTSAVKVGVTRHTNIPSRWIDQGATQGLIIGKAPRRILAGKIEVALAQHMSDKTNWRDMICGRVQAADLLQCREQAHRWFPDDLANYALNAEAVQTLEYPVLKAPAKVSSHNLDKAPEFVDTLWGIRGQYLIFAHRVINLRKYSGYHVEFDLEG
jgi:hypothetical protein